jgi:hypothetical protein
MKWLSTRGLNKHLVPISLLVFGSVFLFPSLASADIILNSFKAKDSLAPGWIVALDQKDQNTILAAPASDSSRIYGVVVDPSQVPFTVQKQTDGQQYFVATTGSYPVLVNAENGAISPGDYISLSSTDGIGAKATFGQSYVLGKALEKFDGKNNVITKDSSGVAIGRINVTIGPSKSPLVKNDVAVPSALKKVGEGIAGKDVAAIRIYTAMFIFFMTALVSAVILWVGVRGGMVAIGRNPLSRRYIIRGLIQVISIAVLIFLVGVVGVYLLLKI